MQWNATSSSPAVNTPASLSGTTWRVQDMKRREQEVSQLRGETGALSAVAGLAEERVRELMVQNDATSAERGAALEQVAALHAEKRGVEDCLRQTERSLADERTASAARAEVTEGRIRELAQQKEELERERGLALERLAATQAERAALEELVRRTEQHAATLADEKRVLDGRAEASEARCLELLQQKDALQVAHHRP